MRPRPTPDAAEEWHGNEDGSRNGSRQPSLTPGWNECQQSAPPLQEPRGIAEPGAFKVSLTTELRYGSQLPQRKWKVELIVFEALGYRGWSVVRGSATHYNTSLSVSVLQNRVHKWQPRIKLHRARLFVCSLTRAHGIPWSRTGNSGSLISLYDLFFFLVFRAMVTESTVESFILSNTYVVIWTWRCLEGVCQAWFLVLPFFLKKKRHALQVQWVWAWACEMIRRVCGYILLQYPMNHNWQKHVRPLIKVITTARYTPWCKIRYQRVGYIYFVLQTWRYGQKTKNEIKVKNEEGIDKKLDSPIRINTYMYKLFVWLIRYHSYIKHKFSYKTLYDTDHNVHLNDSYLPSSSPQRLLLDWEDNELVETLRVSKWYYIPNPPSNTVDQV